MAGTNKGHLNIDFDAVRTTVNSDLVARKRRVVGAVSPNSRDGFLWRDVTVDFEVHRYEHLLDSSPWHGAIWPTGLFCLGFLACFDVRQARSIEGVFLNLTF